MSVRQWLRLREILVERYSEAFAGYDEIMREPGELYHSIKDDTWLTAVGYAEKCYGKDYHEGHEFLALIDEQLIKMNY